MLFRQIPSQKQLTLLFILLPCLCFLTESKCSRGCDLALGSYRAPAQSNFTFISRIFNETIPNILSYNPDVTDQNFVSAGRRYNIPFSCDCLNSEFLGHIFNYAVISGDTYDRISTEYYAHLTTLELLRQFNNFSDFNIPDNGVILNVVVPCSCGDRSVSKDYGLFLTYPLITGETLDSIAATANLTVNLLQGYNPDANFTSGTGVVYIPSKDRNGVYPPLRINKGISSGVIIGIAIAGVAAVFLLAIFIYFVFFRKKRIEQDKLLLQTSPYVEKMSNSVGSGAASVGLTGITVGKSVEFTYEELAAATNDFSIANKIGQGGFGAVYYAELRGEKAAIKKMEMQATKEFLAELNVLTHVHHSNLVRLIGYCAQGSLFLVYEYVENGNLSQHLRRLDREPLPWSTRVQIALDSARGLEYIHEHTVTVYIHRDIKSENILVDKDFRGKVADFGLAKLTKVDSTGTPTNLVGTFGYMSPEYARYGEVSPKVDVFAFGVVLFELISAKEAIVKATSSSHESRGLIDLFDEVLIQPDPKHDLRKLIDARLGDDYPFDSVCKVAHLAKACTQQDPQLRPSMRSIVVALMTLSSSTDDWDVGALFENEALVNLMSGR
ncbi:lysM domain receptor-like kinase 3 [Impatiens glandulifera]|uniref:lysM domain receptor-like kinase 3 n=1 Tax=Impatiens glandulifera TaxID=253017 RepID=UPI001FB0B0AD|nr:lysM domain receptor-like kinase 3 [Impatiens glandulifera]